MDIKQLSYFVAIAEEKNITAAANRLHMSQPPLSIQLKQLEEELGVRLIERNGKRFDLTDKGLVLYKHALTLINEMEEIKNELKETEEGTKGTLSVGINTLSVPGFTEILEAFHQKYPQVSLKIVQNDSFHLTELVKNRVVELAFVRLPLEHQGLAYHHLFSESFVFVSTEPVHNISLKDLTNVPLIMPSTEGLGIYNLILDAFSKEQVQSTRIGECSDMKILMEMVTAGMGATIVPQSVMDVHGNKSLYSCKVSESTLVSSLGMIWLEHHFISGPAKNFLKLVREKMKIRL